MGRTINIAHAGPVTLPADNYDNCHFFTRDVILVMSLQGRINLRYQNQVQALNNAADMLAITSQYEEMCQNNGNFFEQNQAIAPDPYPNLILFKAGEIIMHSMLEIGSDSWIGANNIFSLGAPDTYIQTYLGISTRCYKAREVGGWMNQKMYGLMQGDSPEPYEMYRIPLT